MVYGARLNPTRHIRKPNFMLIIKRFPWLNLFEPGETAALDAVVRIIEKGVEEDEDGNEQTYYTVKLESAKKLDVK